MGSGSGTAPAAARRSASSAVSYCCRCWRTSREAEAAGHVPGLREAASPAGRRRAGAETCSRACARLRRTRSGADRDAAPVPGCRRRARQAAASGMPAMRPARVPARGHRLVRHLLAAPPAERPAPPMRAVRAGQPPLRARACAGGAGSAARSGRSSRAAHLAARLADPPAWLGGFAAHRRRVRARPGLQADHRTRPAAAKTAPDHPQALLERARWPGRSIGHPGPRPWRTSSPSRGLALPTDQAGRLAAGRRQRRIDAVPGPLRPAVAAFAEHCLKAGSGPAGPAPGPAPTARSRPPGRRPRPRPVPGRRARQAATGPLADVHDIEAFLATRAHIAASGG